MRDLEDLAVVATQCVVCGCTEYSACILDDGTPCAWASDTVPVCTAPACIAAMAHNLQLARIGAIALATQ